MDIQRLMTALKRDEGKSLKPYRCTAGRLTIGYGRNLQDVGITDTEAEILLENDVLAVINQLTRYQTFLDLDSVRQEVLANMCFNLGLSRLMQFKKMWAALQVEDFEEAAKQMIDSAWYHQVGARAERLVAAMRSGQIDA